MIWRNEKLPLEIGKKQSSGFFVLQKDINIKLYVKYT